MPESRFQQSGGSPEVSLAEIHIPDDSDFGTGTYTVTFAPRALLSNKAIASLMVRPPGFQISATIYPTREIPVLLGRQDGTPPVHGRKFLLPRNIDLREAKELRVEFANWRIGRATLDGVPIPEMANPGWSN